jgi:hypothetical protein
MFSKTDAYRRMVRPFFLLIILFLIFFNFFSQLPSFFNVVRILKTHQIQSIGREFIALSSYLRSVPSVGYMTCLNSSHPLTDTAIMGPYQQSQFVLSPTILDYLHPLDYRYIILQCPYQAAQEQIQRRLKADIILKSPDGILLLYRKKDR